MQIKRSMYNTGENRESLRVGTIRTLADGTKQVAISLGSRAAESELNELQLQLTGANSKIAQLRQIGLANNVKDIVNSCTRSIKGLTELVANKIIALKSAFSQTIAPEQVKAILNSYAQSVDGLTDLMSGKYIANKSAFRQDLVAKQAKAIVETAFAVSRGKTQKAFNWMPAQSNDQLRKYKAYLLLTDKGLELIPEAKEQIAATFVVWAEGKQADKFIRLCKVVNEFNELTPNKDLRLWHGWQYYFCLSERNGLQMTDNWRLDMIAD